MSGASSAAQLVAGTGNVLSDPRSAVKYVLDETGAEFYEIFLKHGSGDEAAKVIAERFGLTFETARNDLAAFLDALDQKQKCVGTALPGDAHAVLEPTSGCNGGCPHCYHSSHQQQWPKPMYEKVFSQLQNAGIRSVSITGGEVFSPHYLETFFSLVQRLKKQGIFVSSVSTNATFMTETVRDRVLAELSRDTVFRISFDALRGDLLDRVRPGYRKLPDPYGPIRDLDRAGFGLVFTTNIATQPISGILEIGEYLRRYENIKGWNVRLAVPVHFEGSDRPTLQKLSVLPSRPAPTTPLPYFEALLQRHAEAPFAFDISMGNHLTTALLGNPALLTVSNTSHPCQNDERLMVVKATGVVTQCPILPELDASLTMGSLFDERAPLELDKNYAQKLPLAGLDVGDMACATCAYRPVCGGGCRLYSLVYEQGLRGCDLPAKALLEWIAHDTKQLFRTHWPSYHARFVGLMA